MDISPDRVEYMGVSRDLLPTRDPIQTRELLKHLSNAEMFLDDQDDRLVLKSVQPLDRVVLKGLSALYHLVEEIEGTIEQTKDVGWKGQDVLPRRLDFDFHIEGEDSPNHVLMADYQRVWDHLSRHLYSPETHGIIAVREAVTNAIDSCLLQKEIKPDEDCRVAVEYSGDNIIITDNGCGMAPRVIESHLKVLGSSYYHSPWFQSDEEIPNREDVSLIGRYGIGTFSYNLVSDEYEILTATRHDEPRRVLFSKRFGITLGPLARSLLDRGTVVKLSKPATRSEVWPSPDDILSALKGLFRRPRIPLVFKSNGDEEPIGSLDLTEEISISRQESDAGIELVEIQFHGGVEEERIAVGTCFSGSYRIPIEAKEQDPETMVRVYLDIMNRSLVSWMGPQQQTHVLYRGLLISKEHFPQTPFLQGLMSLALPPRGRDYPTMWERKSVSTLDAWIDLDEGTLSLDLGKINLIHDSVYSRELGNALKVLDGVCRKLAGRLLLDADFPWQLKHMLRVATLYRANGTLWSWWQSYDLNDDVIRSVFDGLPCWNPQEQCVKPLGDVLPQSRSTEIGIFPFLPQIVYLHNLYDEHKMLYLKDRILGRNPLDIVARSYEKKVRRNVSDRHRNRQLFFPFFGDEIHSGSMKVLGHYLRFLGFKHIVTNDDVLNKRM